MEAPIAPESKPPYYITFLMGLVFVSQFFSVTVEYSMGFFLLLALIYSVRQDRGSSQGPQTSSPFRKVASPPLRTLTLGVALYTGAILLSSLLVFFAKGDFSDLTILRKEASHFLVKNIILWLVLASGVGYSYLRGFRLSQILKPILIFMCFHFLYVMIQRYTGIHFSRGIGHYLPEDHYAYGVWRTTGFMSHPLTFSFNLSTFLCFLGGMIWMPTNQPDSSERKVYFLIGAIALMTLIAGGSRWPLLVVFMVMGLTLWKLIWRYKKAFLAAVALMALTLWIEGSVLGRFGELFNGSGTLEEKIPRLLFWKVHAQMFWDHPLTGIGLHLRSKVTELYYLANQVSDPKLQFNAHNIFLQTAADSGIIGVAGLFLLFASIVKAAKSLPLPRALIHPLYFIMLSIILGALMQNTLRDSENLYGIWIALIFLVCEISALKQKATP